MSGPRPLARALVVAALVVSASSSTAQQEWSEWRGPARAGEAAGFKTLTSWPSALELRFSTAVGLGHAGPVVAGGIVCTHSRIDKNEVVSCRDLASGALKWSQSYPAPFNTAMGGGHHGAGPKATPTLRDGRLFTFGISGVLSVWDVATGELAWRRDFREEHDKPWPRWGVAASPLVTGGRAYVHAGRKKGAFMALDARSGEEIWRVAGFGAAYGSPILVELDGVRQIVALADKALMGIDLEGELLWRFEQSHRENTPTPVAMGDNVVLAAKGRPTRALRPQRDGESWAVSLVWENKEIPLHMSSAVSAGGDQLCGFSHRKKGFAFCADAATGDVIWRSPNRFAKHATVIKVPGAVLYVTPKGRLRVVEDGDTFRELADYKIAGTEVWAHPAILAESFVVKSYDQLLVWQLPATP